MKIVHIEDFFHPEAGYQLNILSKYMVKFGHEVTIITSEIDKMPDSLTKFFGKEDIDKKDMWYSNLYGVKIIRLPVINYVSGRAIFTSKLFKVIRLENPNVVFVHGNDTLTGMRYLLQYKKLSFPLVMDSHMLEMASNNRFNKVFRQLYKMIFAPIIKKENIKVIRTQNDPYVEKCLGIPLSQAPWISVGSDTMLFHPDDRVREEFRKEYRISNNDFVVIYAGKLDESKGGMILADAIKEKMPVDKKVTFIVVGKTVGEYGDKVEKAFQESENRILRFPTQKYADLARFYQASDLAVFPRQCSLSFYDVQACGLPIVFEDNNINCSRIVNNNGFTFKSGNIEDFRKQMCRVFDMNKVEYQKMCANSVEFVKTNYDYESISREYMKVIENEFNTKRLKR